MYIRKQQLSESNEESVFLFGARQTGKSHLLHTLFPNSIYIDWGDGNVDELIGTAKLVSVSHVY